MKNCTMRGGRDLHKLHCGSGAGPVNPSYVARVLLPLPSSSHPVPLPIDIQWALADQLIEPAGMADAILEVSHHVV